MAGAESVSQAAGKAPWWTGPEHYRLRTGVRHLNPLNVKAPSPAYWQRQAGRDDRGHAIFSDPADGARAAVVLLRTYWRQHQLRTVAAILSRWAPSTDTIGSIPGAPPNSPAGYAEFVRRATGLLPNQTLSLFRPDAKTDDHLQLIALLGAMAEYEVGSGFRVALWIWVEGIRRANQ